MKKIIQKRDIPVNCRLIWATFQIYSQSDYRLAVLTHVKENGFATVESLALELFPGRKIISQRLLDICQDDKLLKNNQNLFRYILTKNGEDSLKHGGYQKHYGKWRIHYIVDPLVPKERQLLKFEEIGKKVKNTKAYCRAGDDVVELENIQFLSGLDEKRDTVEIVELKRDCQRIESDMMVCLRCEITPEGSDLSIKIQTDKPEHDKSDSI